MHRFCHGYLLQFVMVKFLEPRQPSSERIGVMGIKFYGFVRKSVFVDNVDLVS